MNFYELFLQTIVIMNNTAFIIILQYMFVHECALCIYTFSPSCNMQTQCLYCLCIDPVYFKHWLCFIFNLILVWLARRNFQNMITNREIHKTDTKRRILWSNIYYFYFQSFTNSGFLVTGNMKMKVISLFIIHLVSSYEYVITCN